MEEQVPSEHQLDIVPLWMKIVFVVLCSLLVIDGIWKHGLRSWDWLTPAVFLGIFAFPAGVTKPLGKNLRWPLRVVFALWVIACCAWAVHFWGWVPGLALGGISLLSPSRDKLAGWKAYLRKPQNVVFALLALILIISFARSTGAWVPTICVVATFRLLETDILSRRSLGDNLRRRSAAAIAAIAIFAAAWAWVHPSLGMWRA
jgi:hypothetical protein